MFSFLGKKNYTIFKEENLIGKKIKSAQQLNRKITWQRYKTVNKVVTNESTVCKDNYIIRFVM